MHRSAAIGNRPTPRKQLDRLVGPVLDANVIGPEPAIDRRIWLFSEIADRDSNRDAASRRNIREEHCERVETGHSNELKQDRSSDNGLDRSPGTK